MSTAELLLRADLRAFSGYASARRQQQAGEIWLNANESARANVADPVASCRRYPEPQPPALRSALAALYGVAEACLLIGRGSDEGIDLLLRTFCMPGQGAIVTAPPVFGMYAVCARLHGAQVAEVPLQETAAGFVPDLLAMAEAARAQAASLVFVCRPGNPTGECLPLEAIADMARRLRGQALLVVDEAYIEYADQPSASTLLPAHENLVVLRTLSKAHALAAARIGSVLASAQTIAMLARTQAPYPLPQPAIALALQALSEPALAATWAQVAQTIAERERLADALRPLPVVRRLYPSAGNFLLPRFVDTDAALMALADAAIVVRDMRAMPQLGDALRISIGTPIQNDAVIAALEKLA